MRAIVQANAPLRVATPPAEVTLLGWDMRVVLETARSLMREHLDRGWPMVERVLKPQPLTVPEGG